MTHPSHSLAWHLILRMQIVATNHASARKLHPQLFRHGFRRSGWHNYYMANEVGGWHNYCIVSVFCYRYVGAGLKQLHFYLNILKIWLQIFYEMNGLYFRVPVMNTASPLCWWLLRDSVRRVTTTSSHDWHHWHGVVNNNVLNTITTIQVVNQNCICMYMYTFM